MLVSQSQMFLSWDLADCNPSHPLSKGDQLAMSCGGPAAPRGPQAQGAPPAGGAEARLVNPPKAGVASETMRLTVNGQFWCACAGLRGGARHILLAKSVGSSPG